MTAVSRAQRAPMLQAAPWLRMYVAPVDRQTGSPGVFDPSAHLPFDPDAPPAPWIGLGAIRNFSRKSESQSTLLESGTKQLARAQARSRVGATVEFEFLQWGKLQLAIAAGSQQMNVLESPFGAGDRPSGGPPSGWAAVFPGSTATEIVLGEGNTAAFAPGDLIAVDADYAQQTGFVGAGAAAAYVTDPAAVAHDPHYIRRVTFNVSRVRSKTATTLQLAQPLPAGAPTPAMSVQRILGFVDRECGSFRQEWSALFVTGSALGGRVFHHYPRLQTMACGGEAPVTLADGLDIWALPARLLALPVRDVNDGEEVVSFRTYVPAPDAALY
jgi:hypothetical protein